MVHAADFWSAALGYRGPEQIDAGDQFAKVADPAGSGPTVLIQRADDIPAAAAPLHRFGDEQSATTRPMSQRNITQERNQRVTTGLTGQVFTHLVNRCRHPR